MKKLGIVTMTIVFGSAISVKLKRIVQQKTMKMNKCPRCLTGLLLLDRHGDMSCLTCGYTVYGQNDAELEADRLEELRQAARRVRRELS